MRIQDNSVCDCSDNPNAVQYRAQMPFARETEDDLWTTGKNDSWVLVKGDSTFLIKRQDKIQRRKNPFKHSF